MFFSDSPPLMPEALDEVIKKKGPSGFPNLNCWSSSLDPIARWSGSHRDGHIHKPLSALALRDHTSVPGVPLQTFSSALGSL